MSGAPSALAQDLVRARAQAQMTSRVTILRGALGTLDPATGRVGGITGARLIYTGIARIHPTSPAGVIAAGDGTIANRQSIISIPFAAAVPHRDDLLRVDDDGDPDLDTRIFRITDVDSGGAFNACRRLYCTSWHESRYWGQQ